MFSTTIYEYRVGFAMSVNAISHKWNVLRGGLESNNYSDLKLVTEFGESVSCHKVVMAAVSGKVKASLDKKQLNELVVRNVKYQGLKNVFLACFIFSHQAEA